MEGRTENKIGPMFFGANKCLFPRICWIRSKVRHGYLFFLVGFTLRDLRTYSQVIYRYKVYTICTNVSVYII